MSPYGLLVIAAYSIFMYVFIGPYFRRLDERDAKLKASKSRDNDRPSLPSSP